MYKHKFRFFHAYQYLIFLSILNIAYLLIYPQRSVAMLIGLAFIVLISTLFISKILRQKDDILSELNTVINKYGVSSIIILLPFLIPYVVVSSPQIAFWKFDAVGKIILSWLIFSVLWLNLFERARDNRAILTLSTPSLLFIIWSSILWISFAWDVGGSDLFTKVISNERDLSSDRLSSVIFKIWDNYPFSSHFGLAFLSYKDFESHAYSGHSQLYLFSTYLFIKVFQVLGGMKMTAAARLQPLLASIFIAITIIFVFFKTKYRISFNQLTTQLTLFLSIGFFLTLPDFWITLLKYNVDNPMPWIMCIILMMFTYVIQGDYDSKGFKFLLYFLCLYSYMMGVICLITLIFFMFQKNDLNKFVDYPQKLIRILCTGLALAMISSLYPKIAIMALGYREEASSFLFRSGLDGDTMYYDNIFQAVISPYAQHLIRPWSSLIPASLFTAIILFLDRRKNRDDNNLGTLSNIIFLFSPYLFLIVFFPQATSIHPYNYDYVLLFPLAFLAMNGSISQEFQQRINGPKAYLFFLFMAAIVIFNLTKIAQAAKYL